MFRGEVQNEKSCPRRTETGLEFRRTLGLPMFMDRFGWTGTSKRKEESLLDICHDSQWWKRGTGRNGKKHRPLNMS